MTHHIFVCLRNILQLLQYILHCQYITIIAIYIARTLIHCNIYCKDPETLQYILQGSWDIAINIDIANWVAIILQFISPIIWRVPAKNLQPKCNIILWHSIFYTLPHNPRWRLCHYSPVDFLLWTRGMARQQTVQFVFNEGWIVCCVVRAWEKGQVGGWEMWSELGEK